jgi:hypothetical protein
MVDNNLAMIMLSPGYNVRGAILLAPFGSGPGARPAPNRDRAGVLIEARLRIEQNIVMLPTSEPLAHIDKWPAVFFCRGLWDFAEPLEATYDAYTLCAASRSSSSSADRIRRTSTGLRTWST